MISLSREDSRSAMLAEGLPEEITERMLDLERYFHEGRMSRVTSNIKQLNGKAAGQFGQYAREVAVTGAWEAGSAQGAA